MEFRRLGEEHLELVLGWRTQPDVTRYMFSDVSYDLEKHRRWFAKVSADPNSRYWVIYHKERPIGLITMTDLDPHHRHCQSGYYIGEPEFRLLGGYVPPYLYNHLFFNLGLKKVVVEVMAGNEGIMKIHRMHGYREVGVLRQHIFKYGQYHDVHIFELLDEAWREVAPKYKKCVAPFPD